MGMLINLFLEPDGNKLNVLVFTRERRCCRSCESGSKIVANFILPLSLVKTLDNDSETKVQLESEHVDPQNVEFQTRIENGLGKPHSSVEISQEENVHSLEKSINSVISSDCMNDQVAFGIESTSIGSTDIRALEVQNTNTDLFVENSIFASNLQSQDSNEKRKDDIQKPTEKREANSNTNDNEIVHFVTETSNPLITKSYTKTFSSSDWNVNDSEVLKCDLPVMIDTSDKTSHENLQTNFIASESRLTDAVTHSNVRSINYEQYILPAEDELAIDNQIYVPLSNVSIKTENVCEESIPANTEIQPVKTEPYDNLENSEQDYSGIIPTSITNVVIEVVKAEVSSVEGHNEKLIKYDVDSVKAEAVPSPEFLACEFGPSLNEFCPSTVKIKKKISFADPLCTDLEQVVEAIKKPVGDVDDVQQHQKPTIEKPNVTSTNEIQTAKHGETIEQMKILEKNLNISSSEYTGVLKQIKKRSHEIEKKFSALTITNSELKIASC